MRTQALGHLMVRGRQFTCMILPKNSTRSCSHQAREPRRAAHRSPQRLSTTGKKVLISSLNQRLNAIQLPKSSVTHEPTQTSIMEGESPIV